MSEKKRKFDLLTVDIDELEFRCVDKQFEDEVVDPENGDLLKKNFSESGFKLESQYPNIYIHDFSQGDGHVYAMRIANGDPAIEPWRAFVLFLGGLRIPFSVTNYRQYADDGTTRIWEIKEIGERGVFCKSAFKTDARLRKLRNNASITVAYPFKFSSRKQQNMTLKIIEKALSIFNHMHARKYFHKGGAELTKTERHEMFELKKKDRLEFERKYERYNYARKEGDAEFRI